MILYFLASDRRFFNLPSHKIVFRLIIIQPATIATQIRQRSHQLLYRSSIQDGDLSQLSRYSEILSCSSDVVRSDITADIHKLIFWACYLSILTLFCNNMTSYRDYRELPSPSFKIKTLPSVIFITVKIGDISVSVVFPDWPQVGQAQWIYWPL